MSVPVISISNGQAVEGGYLDFTVTLSAPATTMTRVYYRTLDGSAVALPDYTREVSDSYNYIQFDVGQQSKTLTIRPSEDTLNELDETVVVELYNPTAGAVLAGNAPLLRGTGVILDNDGLGANLSFSVSSLTLVEGAAGTQQAQFEILLSQAATKTMTFDYATANGGASAGSDYTAKSGTVTIAAGQKSAIVAVDVRGDTTVELTENFSLYVTSREELQAREATATILDDDAGGGTHPVVSLSGGQGVEGGYIDFTVTLSAPATGTTRVYYRTLDDSAIAGVDYTGVSGSVYDYVQFSAGERSKTITIRPSSDTLSEHNETMMLELTSITGGGAVFAGGASTIRAIGTIIEGTYILGGTDDAETLVGTPWHDSISGGGGNDRLAGLGGDDTLLGGEGADSLYGGNGVDRLEGGNGNDLLDGGLGPDYLFGGAGNDTLQGGSFGDTMAGGTGDDTYEVENARDKVIEAAGAGTDLVRASINHALAANVENLTLTGSSRLNGYGNALDNVLTGNSASNLLDGGAGADTMIGGAGNDIYVVDRSGDRVVEAAGGGTDLVRSSVSLTLAENVENLTLLGTANLNGAGNALNNVLTGNSGNNVLNGKTGADTMTGGAGNDTYYMDHTGDQAIEAAGGGIDLVVSLNSRTLGANIENLTLIGGANAKGSGNALNNVLTGNSGHNLLNGGAGNDTMIGGAGNDSYIVNTAGDKVIEAAGQGIDLVTSSASYALSANVENLTLAGTKSLSGVGNALNNVLTGNSGNNFLNGGAGADTMIGGAGNDTYVVDRSGDHVVETAGGGTDLVRSTVSLTLAENVENLTLLGTANLNGAGNALDNVMTGNSGNNVFNGKAGADVLIGGAGADVLTGGVGADVFMFLATSDSTVAAAGRDTIQDFSHAQGDLVDLSRIDANTLLSGDQAFDFIGSSDFSGSASELRYQNEGTQTYVFGDVDGDRNADFAIRFASALTPDDGYFVL